MYEAGRTVPREKCESHLPSLHPHRKKVGAQSENGKSWAPGTPRLARLVCMASSDPLPGPDAKTPAFPNDFFSHELERLPALAGARRRRELRDGLQFFE